MKTNFFKFFTGISLVFLSPSVLAISWILSYYDKLFLQPSTATKRCLVFDYIKKKR